MILRAHPRAESGILRVVVVRRTGCQQRLPGVDGAVMASWSERDLSRDVRTGWCSVLVILFLCGCSSACADDRLLFFEQKIRPILVQHCYQCHSAESPELQAGLRLDVRAGWQKGGDAGEPVIIPGEPADSPLLRAMQHESGVSAMPPDQPRLSAAVLAEFSQWISDGAVDPRDGEVPRRDRQREWESEFQERLDWWSLQGPVAVPVPVVTGSSWVRGPVDHFIMAKLEAAGLEPSAVADRATLLRRLSFVLTGLPPQLSLQQQFLSDVSPDAAERVVDQLLSSPQFGERWARHWMDVVHYTDTHGYEWDVPVKHAWRYRDYLIRSFNQDVPYQRFVMEQIAGDLLEPRLDSETGLNESLIAPLMLRLGERRHGDNSAAEGISQEAVSSMVDTLGKAFLGTTLACTQCHDHKLDAVEQRDYYSLSGMLMSTRFSSRTVDAVDPNVSILESLREIRGQLCAVLAKRWLEALRDGDSSTFAAVLQAVPADQQAGPSVPATLLDYWKRARTNPVTGEQFRVEQQLRIAANAANLKVLADFSRADGASGWQWDGFGMRHGLAADGELVVSEEGDRAIVQLLPAGRYSYLWSARLAGLLQGPEMDPLQPVTFSVLGVTGKFASQAFVVDRALNPERMQFPSRPQPVWSTVTAGQFDSLEGTVDAAARRVYFELATKSLNNYFPPRVGYGGVSEAECADERSWFGVSRIVQHAPGHPPQDELRRFEPLFSELSGESDWQRRLRLLVQAAVLRWQQHQCTSEDALLLNDAVQSGLLPVDLAGDAETADLVASWRQTASKLQPDRTVGSVAEWPEGRDDRLAIRGAYTDLGSTVPRGMVRMFPEDQPLNAGESGRLRLARRLASERNPLLSRVWVNRVWHYLFGAGLVRTTDDFGHLGEQPVHPELLDYLAVQFMRDGWSTKRLIRGLVLSAVWQQSSLADRRAIDVDPENRLWHYRPLRRLEAEALRDSLLMVSGRLTSELYGPTVEPWRVAEDASKRLFRGPLDGGGRRSLYLEMTLMEPPRFLALFNQPLPKQTTGRRDVTTTADQALALLNDPFVLEMAGHWSRTLVQDASGTAEERAAVMLSRALSRPPSAAEVEGLVLLARESAQLRGIEPSGMMAAEAVWADAAHAVFNLKEFLYVP